MMHKAQSLASGAVAALDPTSTYTFYTDPAVEPPLPNEAALQSELNDIIRRLISNHFAHHRHGFRGTHVKTQAILKGSLTVQPDLPPHLAQGLFSHGDRTYSVGFRFANEPIFLQDDKEPGPKGVGMRVFGLSESDFPADAFLDKIGAETHTQDFTFNNAPVLELRDLPTTVEIMGLRERNYNNPEKIDQEVKKRSDASLQTAPKQLPNRHFMSYTFYSQSAYRFGEFVAKYALFPTSETQKELEKSSSITSDAAHDQHAQWLKQYFSEHDATFDFRVQLLRDPKVQSVEDTAMEWDETAFPYETVGKVVIPKGQDPLDDKRRVFWDDRMKLNTWYGLKEHMPLGSSNRARRELYKVSSSKRAGLNDQTLKDVKSIDEIP